MTLREALRSVARTGGSVYLVYKGTPYRLVVKEGYIRLLLIEAGKVKAVAPDEALELLRRMAEQAETLEAFASPVEVAVRPPGYAILAEPKELGLLA